MKHILVFLLLPLAGFSQCFEKTISETYFQRPQDIIETGNGYLLITSEHEEATDKTQSRVILLSKDGNIIKQRLFNKYYFDEITNATGLSDNTYLLAGYYLINENDSIKFIFRKINNNLDVIEEAIIETSTNLYGAVSLQADLALLNNSAVYAFGYHSFTNENHRGVYLFKLEGQLSSITTKHYERLDLPIYSLPECLLPNNDNTLFLFFPGKVYMLNNNCEIVDSFPDDFVSFRTEDGLYAIYRPLSASWLNDKLIIGGHSNVFSYNSNLEKESFLRFDYSDSGNDIYAAYNECMSVYNGKAFLSFAFNLTGGWWYGYENHLRILKIDNELNIFFDSTYNVGDGYYYAPFNTLATKDNGCLIATTRNNLDKQGERVDVYLLKVDSNGKLDTTTHVKSLQQNQCRIYPNPAKDIININFDNRALHGKLLIYNTQGILVKEVGIEKTLESISITDLEPGVYYCLIMKDKAIFDKGKWIKM